MRDCCYLGFLLSLLFVASFCNADGNTYEVVGTGECADCDDNFKINQVFSGLHVSVDCKLRNGETKRIGAGRLDKLGNFKISLPNDVIVQNGQLKEECYAQLHNSVAAPCPAHDGLEAAKIIFKSQNDKKFTFVPTKKVRFSSALCSSKFAWPYFKHRKTHSHWKKKKFPKINFPPIKNFLHPFPPLYKPKPIPPPMPVYNPPVVPIYKPKPKPPVYKPKPKPPVVKPQPPHVPIYKPKPKSPVVKPLPPHGPSYKPKPKPKPPVYKPTPKPKPPVYKPTPKPPVVISKPMPPPTPLFPFPFHKKKPCPPFPKIPKKHFFHHPKFGYFPPLPPFDNIPQP